MLSKLTLLNAMQIKISLSAAYDFNQLIHAVCSPPQPHRFLAWPLPAPPRPVKKIASPSIPGPRSCSRPSTHQPCTSPSRLSCLSTPLAVPLVLCLTLVTVCPTPSPSTKDMPFPMLASGLTLLAVTPSGGCTGNGAKLISTGSNRFCPDTFRRLHR